MGILSIEEVAERLKLAKSTVKTVSWRKMHGLESFKIGSRVMFEEQEVEAFIARKKRESKERLQD